MRFPTRQPTTIATSALGSESAGTRTAPGDDDEERDAEIAPEEAEVEPAEHAEPLGDRLDAPGSLVPAQYAPRPERTAGSVRAMIVTSDQIDQFSMYVKSSRTRSSNSSPERPEICQSPVIPGRTW